jgi:hypothetical protein
MKYLFILIFFLSSCGAYRDSVLRKYCKADTTTTIKIDTVVSFKRDTLVLGGDTIVQKFQVPCEGNKAKPIRKVKKTDFAKSIITIDTNGVLTDSCICDSLVQVNDSLTMVINTLEERNISHTIQNDSFDWKIFLWVCAAFCVGYFLCDIRK